MLKLPPSVMQEFMQALEEAARATQRADVSKELADLAQRVEEFRQRLRKFVSLFLPTEAELLDAQGLDIGTDPRSLTVHYKSLFDAGADCVSSVSYTCTIRGEVLSDLAAERAELRAEEYRLTGWSDPKIGPILQDAYAKQTALLRFVERDLLKAALSALTP